MNKKECQNRHARRRAAERFGISMGPRLHAELVAAIQSGRAAFVERQSSRISVWDLDIDGEIVRLVYDRRRKQIVTFLHHTFPDQKPSPLATASIYAPKARNYDWGAWLERHPPSRCDPPTVAKIDRETVREHLRVNTGLDLPVARQLRYLDAIAKGEARFVNYQSKNVKMYEVADGGQLFWVMLNVASWQLVKVIQVKKYV